MNPVFITIVTDDWEHLRRSLFTDDGKENAAVLLCGAADTDAGRRLLVRRVSLVPVDQYRVRESDCLEVSPAFYNKVVDTCSAERLHPVIVHAHPQAEVACYSRSDDCAEARLLPVLEALLPGMTPASLVLTPTVASGRRFSSGRFLPLYSLAVVGPRTRVLALKGGHKPEEQAAEQFDRQIRAFGLEAQCILGALRIAIVGVGGTGSLVGEQLARAGVRDILLIDPDVVEPSNVSRLFGAGPTDIGKRKVDVLGTHLSALGATRVERLAESAIRQAVLMQLRDRDLVFGCVDNDRSRAVLNRFSCQYLVPVVDLGIRLDARGGEMRAAAGRVSILGSGMVCLRCSHHISADRILAESLPDTERRALAREGYVLGVDVPVPAVVSLNATIAALGVTAALNLFVSLTGGAQPVDQLYDATSGVLFTTQPVHEKGCDVCDAEIGVKALGDGQIVSAYE